MEQGHSRKIVTRLAIDPALLGKLDQAAADLDRSRSWLAAKAIENYLHPATDSVSHEASRPGVAAMPDVPVPGGAPDGATEGSSPPQAPVGRAFSKGSRMTDHYRDAIERQAAIDRERAAEAARQLERVTQQNREAIERLENGDIE
jgi:hypothetical protein